MGLDMYLYRKIYVKRWSHQPEAERFAVTVTKGGVDCAVDSEKISEITEEIAYWRKANQIHNWFVKNVQEGKDECQESYVELRHIIELDRVCKEVLADHSKAAALLPATAGFFFGSTELDDSYFEDVARTVAMLKPYLSIEYGNTDATLYYRASW